MARTSTVSLLGALALLLGMAGCDGVVDSAGDMGRGDGPSSRKDGSSGRDGAPLDRDGAPPGGDGGPGSDGRPSSDGAVPDDRPPTNPWEGPPAGWPEGQAEVPEAGRAEDTSSPTTVIGTGTPESCTGDDFVAAVAEGGVITFDCGPDPVIITLTETAKVFNDRGTKLVIDGGNRVTLSGGGKIRILYMATCDEAQVYPPGPGDCNSNPGVQLVVQNITFIDGNASNIPDENNRGGGGAIYAQGGSLKVVNARFFNNRCAERGSDVGGGAIRKLDYLPEPGAGPARPVWVVNSTFGGGPGLGNSCANGGALSSIGVSWNIINTVISESTATGMGASDGEGGNGGGIYNDGNEIVLNITSSLIENNVANEGGSAVFFVSNNRTGTITIVDSIIRNNPRGTFETPDLPGFFVIAREPPTIINSQIFR